MKYFNFSLGLMLCLACVSYHGNAQNIRVEAKLDTSSIMMGDQTILHLSARVPAKTAINFPVLTDTLSSKVQIVKPGKTDTISDKDHPGTQIISRQYTITSFDAGLQMVPSFTFHSKKDSFSTNALPLQVMTVKIDTTKSIYDIKEPLQVKYSWMDWLREHWLWVVLPLLGIILVIALIWYFRKNRKEHLPLLPAKPKIPAHRLALEKLYALRDQKLWQQDQVKSYHSELTDIIREYLEKRYHIKALEQTSEEIFAGLRSAAIPEQNRNQLRQMLLLADLVKFAKEKPLNTENEQSMDNAINFVTNTQPAEPVIENKEEQQ